MGAWSLRLFCYRSMANARSLVESNASDQPILACDRPKCLASDDPFMKSTKHDIQLWDARNRNQQPHRQWACLKMLCVRVCEREFIASVQIIPRRMSFLLFVPTFWYRFSSFCSECVFLRVKSIGWLCSYHRRAITISSFLTASVLGICIPNF